MENDEIAVAAQSETREPEVNKAKDKPRRRPLPEHLERKEQVLSPGEDCSRCGGDLKALGVDFTEELEYVPGRFVVNKIIRPPLTSCCLGITLKVGDQQNAYFNCCLWKHLNSQ